jgi:hypothetical protein
MSMSLTTDDLKAVKRLIDSSIDERVPPIIDARVQPMLDKLEKRLTRKIDGLRLDVGKFSHETTGRFDELNGRADDFNQKLASTADMTDYNRVETRKLKRKLGLI